MQQTNPINPIKTTYPIKHEDIIGSNSYASKVELDISDSSLNDEQKTYLELVVKKFQSESNDGDYRRIRKTTHRTKSDEMNDDKKKRLAQTLTSCIVEKDGKKVLVLFENPLFFVRKTNDEILIIPGTTEVFEKGGFKKAKKNKAVWIYDASNEDEKFKINSNLETILLISDLNSYNKNRKEAAINNFKTAKLVYGKEEFPLAPYITEQKIYSIDRNRGPELQSKASLKNNREETISLLIKIAGVLKSFHEKGLIHFDLKLPNLLIDSNDKISIIDFDQVRKKISIFEEETDSTEGYIPKAYFLKFTLSQKQDIFSFIMMAIETLKLVPVLIFFSFFYIHQLKSNPKATPEKAATWLVNTFPNFPDNNEEHKKQVDKYFKDMGEWISHQPLELFCMKSFLRQGIYVEDNWREVFNWNLIEKFLTGFSTLNSEGNLTRQRIQKLMEVIEKSRSNLPEAQQILIDSFVIRLVAGEVTAALIVSLKTIPALEELWKDQCFSDDLKLEKKFNEGHEARKKQYNDLLSQAKEHQDFAGWLLKMPKIKNSIVGASLQKNIDELNIRKDEFERLTKQEGFEFFKENCCQNFKEYLQDLQAKLINYSKYNAALVTIEKTEKSRQSSLAKLNVIFSTMDAREKHQKKEKDRALTSLCVEIEAVRNLMGNPDEFVSNESNFTTLANLAECAQKISKDLVEKELQIQEDLKKRCGSIYAEERGIVREIITKLSEMNDSFERSFDKDSAFYKEYSKWVKDNLGYWDQKYHSETSQTLMETSHADWDKVVAGRAQKLKQIKDWTEEMYKYAEKVSGIFDLLKGIESREKKISAVVNGMGETKESNEYKKRMESARQQLNDFKRTALTLEKTLLDDQRFPGWESSIRDLATSLMRDESATSTLGARIEKEKANIVGDLRTLLSKWGDRLKDARPEAENILAQLTKINQNQCYPKALEYRNTIVEALEYCKAIETVLDNPKAAEETRDAKFFTLAWLESIQKNLNDFDLLQNIIQDGRNKAQSELEMALMKNTLQLTLKNLFNALELKAKEISSVPGNFNRDNFITAINSQKSFYQTLFDQISNADNMEALNSLETQVQQATQNQTKYFTQQVDPVLRQARVAAGTSYPGMMFNSVQTGNAGRGMPTGGNGGNNTNNMNYSAYPAPGSGRGGRGRPG